MCKVKAIKKLRKSYNNLWQFEMQHMIALTFRGPAPAFYFLHRGTTY